MSGAEQSREHGQNLCWHRGRNYIAVTDGRERDYLIVEVINQRASLGRGWVRDVRQEIVFEGEDGQNTAKKKRPEKVTERNENWFPSGLLQKMEQRAQAYPIHHKNRRQADIEEIISFRAKDGSLDYRRDQNRDPKSQQLQDRPDGIVLVDCQLNLRTWTMWDQLLTENCKPLTIQPALPVSVAEIDREADNEPD